MRLSLLMAALMALCCIAADAGPTAALRVDISRDSIRLGDTELRSGSRVGGGRYLSLDAAKAVLGPPQRTSVAGLGVGVCAWPEVGIHMQRGFRGPDKGKYFKLQVFFQNSYDKAERTHSGTFQGNIRIEGVDITAATRFDKIRTQLEKADIKIEVVPDLIRATKGNIQIFTVGGTNRIERVEVWCP